MKTIKLFILATFLTLSCNIILSQAVDTIYYNNKWERLTNSKGHKYYSIVTVINDSLVNSRDYFKNGKLYMTGSYKSLKLEEEIGQHYYYRKNGEEYCSILYNYDRVNDTIENYLITNYNLQQKKLQISYVIESESKYTGKGIEVNDERFGVWYFYNKENGELSHKVEYENGKMNGTLVDVFNSWDQVEKKDVGKIHITGEHKNGKKNGVWTYYRPNGKMYEKRIYSEGKLITSETFDY